MQGRKEVTRTHVEMANIRGEAGNAKIFYIEETFKDKTVDSWIEDEKGRLLILCDEEDCLNTMLNHNIDVFICDWCVKAQEEKELDAKLEAEYQVKFCGRIKKFALALRKIKECKNWKIRAGRGKPHIVLTVNIDTHTKVRDIINKEGISFNLKAGLFTRNAQTGYRSWSSPRRYTLTFIDINPMLDVFFK